MIVFFFKYLFSMLSHSTRPVSVRHPLQKKETYLVFNSPTCMKNVYVDTVESETLSKHSF